MISFGLIKLIKKHWFRFKLRKASPHDRAELMRNKFYFLGKNSIVAVGSIVTKRIPDGEVWGGIPAKFIMKTEDYARKMVEESKKFTWMPYSKKTSMTQEELIRHQQNFFFGNKA